MSQSGEFHLQFDGPVLELTRPVTQIPHPEPGRMTAYGVVCIIQSGYDVIVV